MPKPEIIILGINTATSRAEIALLQIIAAKAGSEAKTGIKAKKLFAKSWQSNRDEAEKIMPVLAAALKVAAPKTVGAKGFRPVLNKIFVVSGPGSFTGLRIGVTVANTLAFLFNAPVVSISTFDYLRAKIEKKYQKSTGLLLKAGGEFAVVQAPGSTKTQRLNFAELKPFFNKHKTIKFLVTDASPEDRKKYVLPGRLKWLPERNLRKFSDIMVEVIAKKHTSHKIIKPQYLLPPKITVSKKEIFTRATPSHAHTAR
jgi:tRNA threonylcarbamoyl adenosine modification protein YeaZ